MNGKPKPILLANVTSMYLLILISQILTMIEKMNSDP